MPGPSILVVDDEEDILVTLKAYLEGALGANVVTATRGAAALDLLAKSATPFDLILSDFRMPVMDGLHFLRRAEEMRSEVPRIMMTAFPDMQLAIDALNRARIARFLAKPLDPDHLLAVVREVLDPARRQRQRDAALQRSADVAARKDQG